MMIAPSACIAASTRCEAKKRSAIRPRNSGEITAAIGPAE
jgi:hypothetical protein